MKNLILSEGKHDTLFFKEVFGTNEVNKYFNLMETLNKSDHKLEESKVYRSFRETTSPRQNLFKSEGGKDKVFPVLKYLRGDILSSEKDLRLILVRDADSAPPNRIFELLMQKWLKEGVCGTLSGEQYDWTKKDVYENQDFVIYEVKIHFGDVSKSITTSRVILFKKSLEGAVANAGGGNVESKIKAYARLSHIKKAIVNSLF